MSDGHQIRNQNSIHFLTLTIVGWIDIFAYKQYRDVIIDNLRYCQEKKDLRLFAYVIMSNHIHIICQTDNPKGLSNLMKDFRSFTAKEILKLLQEDRNQTRAKWILTNSAYNARFNTRNENFQVWNHGLHPVELESPSFIEQRLNYIHLNPVRAGIVDNAKDYIYSSARDYEGIKGILEIEKFDLGPSIGYLY